MTVCIRSYLSCKCLSRHVETSITGHACYIFKEIEYIQVLSTFSPHQFLINFEMMVCTILGR